MADSSRTRAERLGRNAERIAVLLLRAKGFAILAQRLRNPAGEIDILARRGRTVVVCEVKARQRLEDAHLALSPASLRRVARAARQLGPRHIRPQDFVRLDAILVAPWRFPRHLVNIADVESP